MLRFTVTTNQKCINTIKTLSKFNKTMDFSEKYKYFTFSTFYYYSCSTSNKQAIITFQQYRM